MLSDKTSISYKSSSFGLPRHFSNNNITFRTFGIEKALITPHLQVGAFVGISQPHHFRFYVFRGVLHV